MLLFLEVPIVLSKAHYSGALAGDVFEARTETGSEYFACQDSALSQIFKLIVSTSQKILDNINAVVWREVK